MTNEDKRFDHATVESAGAAHVLVRLYNINDRERAYAVVDSEQAISLITNLLSVLQPGMFQRHLNAGNCDTCGNTRIVSVENQHGRKESVRCPDCGSRFDAPLVKLQPFPFYR